jgi:hypothetical protein
MAPFFAKFRPNFVRQLTIYSAFSDIFSRNFGKVATPSLMVWESWRRAFNTTEFISIVISAQSEG